ncbi:MAG: choice-of-anchor D domain-containing protein, partial [Methylotenera sp.]|nr:choice-of-anchor D domain-containing protein [Oligoflexia bacterium]
MTFQTFRITASLRNSGPGFVVRTALGLLSAVGLSGCLSNNGFQWSQEFNILPALTEGRESNLHWSEGSITSGNVLTAMWTPSAASTFAAQKVQLFVGGACATASGIPISMTSSTVSVHSFAGTDGQAYSFKIVSLASDGSELSSSCSAPIAVDTTAPSLLNVTAPANLIYKAGDTIDFTVNFSEPVSVSPVTRLALDIGGTPRYANYLTGTGTPVVVYRYSVVAPDLDTNGIGLSSPLNMNGGSITDAASNSLAALTFTSPITTGILVDTSLPMITSVTPPANGSYKAAQNLDFTINFSKVVTLTGTSRLALDVGGITRYASYISGSGSSAALYRYMVTSPDQDMDGVQVASPLDVNGGTLQDALGNTAAVVFTPPSMTSVFVDTTSPLIVSITPPANLTYKAGNNLDFVVNFTENVNASGSTRLQLDVGGVTRYAAYFSGNGTAALTYRYTVVSPDTDANGIGMTSPLQLNGGTLTDAALNSALLIYTAPNTSAVLVDTTAPAITGILKPALGTYTGGQNLDFTVNFSEPVVAGPLTRIGMLIGGVTRYAIYLSGSGTSAISYRYSVVAPDSEAAGITLISPLDLNGGTLQDVGANDASLTFISVANPGILVSTTAPALAWSPPNYNFGTFTVGTYSQTYTFRFTNSGGPASGCGALVPTDTTNFSILSNQCGASSLASGQSCAVQVRANPGSVGSKTLSLSRTCSVGGTASTGAITAVGAAAAPALSWAQSSIEFGTVRLTKFSAPVSITFRNTGTADAGTCSLASLSNASDFIIDSQTCATAQPAGSECSVIVRAKPGTTGAKSGNLVRTCSAATSASVTLTTNGSTAYPISVASRGRHSCAVLSDNAVQCWGQGGYGELGDGNAVSHYVPTLVPGLTATSVVGGSTHSCALLVNGAVKCWGTNGNGQLGDSTTVQRNSPTLVPVVNATAITAGLAHTCALLSNGTVQCWGYNIYGQLGNGSTADSASPVTVTGLSTGVIAIGSGDHTTCAVLSDHTAACWGFGTYGQLGNGIYANSLTPVTVSGLSGVSRIGGGTYHSCAVLQNGTVRCWGNNQNGQLGNATTVGSPVSVLVFGVTSALTLASGNSHNCITITGGQVSCWGMNTDAQLGDGTTTNRTSPVLLLPLSSATEIAAGDSHSCALTGDTIHCWGDNAFGQLGDNSTTVRPSPTAANGLVNVIAATSGSQHTCAVLADHTVQCWGSNGKGQLGDGTTVNHFVPAPVTGITDAVGVSAGYAFSCAWLSGGGAKCWGSNGGGALGNGLTFDSAAPVTVVNSSSIPLTGVVGLSSGGSHTCALLSDTSIQCWGNNSYGQLGNGSLSSASGSVEVKTDASTTLTGATRVAAGSRHSCAVLTGGAVSCWGFNGSGQLGNGTTTQKSFATAVPGLSSMTQVTAGQDHTCALSNGTVQCWGQYGAGKLGDGVSSTNQSSPVVVTGISTASTLNAGANHTCALLSNGRVECWGENGFYGQLGNGTLLGNKSVITAIDSITSITGGS